MLVILYNSHTGSSEKYARALSEKTGLSCYSVDEFKGDDDIIFFGWLRHHDVVGIEKINKSKLKACCIVGLDGEVMLDRALIQKHNKFSSPIFYLRGWIDRSKLTLKDRSILRIVCIKMRIAGLNEFTRPLYDMMLNGGSLYDESYLNQIVEFLEKE